MLQRTSLQQEDRSMPSFETIQNLRETHGARPLLLVRHVGHKNQSIRKQTKTHYATLENEKHIWRHTPKSLPS